MKQALAAVLSAGFMAIFALDVSAACPVGKKIGETWCENGMIWRCDKCASQDCPIFTGTRCMKNDTADAASRAPLLKLLNEQSREAKRDLPLLKAGATGESL